MSGQKCLRCRSDLPADTNFCVACGFNNEAAMGEKILKVEKQVQKKKESQEMRRGLFRGAWFARFFPW